MSDSYFKKKLKPIKVKEKSISQLLAEMSRTAYQGRKLGEAVDVWENMIKEKDLTIVMGFSGSMSTAGQWTIINWLMEKRFIDVLVSTGANVSEDIVDAMGFGYWQGSQMVDDEALLKADVNRYYDVFGKETDYRKMEEVITDFVMTLKTDFNYSSAEFLYLLGKYLSKKGIKSIAAVAAENGVPIFSPAMADSAYGETFLMAKNQGHNVMLDSVKEFDQFVSIGTKTKDIGVVYIGGGVPKDLNAAYRNFSLASNQRSRCSRKKRSSAQRTARVLLSTQVRHSNNHRLTTMGRTIRLHAGRSHQLGQN